MKHIQYQDSSTPGESPWSNGLCERNHQITDTMLEILVEENPKSDEKILLVWANVAKNSLQYKKNVCEMFADSIS